MALIDDLIRDEGEQLFPYKDARGHLTIGIGINLDAGITHEEAVALANMRISQLQKQLYILLPWISQIGIHRTDALTNMGYNLGIGGLLQFHKMLHALAVQDWDTAASEALNSEWAKQVGDRATRIAAVFKG